MSEILHHHLPFAPWADPRTSRLPGILPIEPGDWLRVDEAFAGQMAERARLMAAHKDEVHMLAPEALAAAQELLRMVLGELAGIDGYRIGPDQATRPDGVTVALDHAAPLMTLGHLCQEDFCVMQKQGDEHVLTGAILCFPASWTLDEKFGRALIGIHHNVPVYDAGIARRVQRLFDALRPGPGLWRANALLYDTAELFHPRREAAPRSRPVGKAAYLRSERQCLVRLPETDAVVFSIHTYLLRRDALAPDQVEGLDAASVKRGS